MVFSLRVMNLSFYSIVKSVNLDMLHGRVRADPPSIFFNRNLPSSRLVGPVPDHTIP